MAATAIARMRMKLEGAEHVRSFPFTFEPM